MPRDRKSMQNIKTVRALLDGRRVRTPAVALMELSTLANERERLGAEVSRLTRRLAEIQVRLAEIQDKEVRLQTFLQAHPLAGVEVPAQPRDTPVSPLAEVPRHVVTRELSY